MLQVGRIVIMGEGRQYLFFFEAVTKGWKSLNSHPWWVLWCWASHWELHNSSAALCYTDRQNKWVGGWDISLWVRQVLNLSGSQFPKREERDRRVSGWRRNHSSLLDGQMCFQLCSQMLQNFGYCWFCFQQTHRHSGPNRVWWMYSKPSCATSGAKPSWIFQEPGSHPWELLFQWLSHLGHLFHPCCTNPQIAQVNQDQQQQTDFSGSFWSFIMAV